MIAGAGLTAADRLPLEDPDQRERQDARPTRSSCPSSTTTRSSAGTARADFGRFVGGVPRRLRHAPARAASASSSPRELIEPRGGGHAPRRQSRGETTVERVFSLVLLGDLVSLYLAVLRGVDPEPVDAITRLKTELAARGVREDRDARSPPAPRQAALPDRPRGLGLATGAVGQAVGHHARAPPPRRPRRSIRGRLRAAPAAHAARAVRRRPPPPRVTPCVRRARRRRRPRRGPPPRRAPARAEEPPPACAPAPPTPPEAVPPEPTRGEAARERASRREAETTPDSPRAADPHRRAVARLPQAARGRDRPAPERLATRPRRRSSGCTRAATGSASRSSRRPRRSRPAQTLTQPW